MSATPEIPDNVVAFYARGSMPRGVRNNNPGNIRLGDQWKGLCSVQMDKSFCQFESPQYGIRAMGYILRNSYFLRMHLNTVRKIIQRWAPNTENDTDSYVGTVSKALGVREDDYIDLRTDNYLGDFVQAIIKHENGSQPYTGLQIISGVRLV